MAIKGLKLSQAEVSQEFDLNDILGVNVTDDEGLAEAVGQFIIDRIVERTQSGRDINGKPFRKYSEAYKDSLEFKAFGKSSHVNMTLSGEMLDTMTITSINKGKIKIGWFDELNNAKAYGHMSGMEGHPNAEGSPKREFFGLSQKDVEAIRKNFKPTNSKKSEENDALIVARLRKLVGA